MIPAELKGGRAGNETVACLFFEKPDGNGDSPANCNGRIFGRDWMGDDLPPDTLHQAPEKGLHFGFPYCHAGAIPDPKYGKMRQCNEFAKPALKLDPHVAPLGMKFYTGSMFPLKYRNRVFIAEQGISQF